MTPRELASLVPAAMGLLMIVTGSGDAWAVNVLALVIPVLVVCVSPAATTRANSAVLTASAALWVNYAAGALNATTQ